MYYVETRNILRSSGREPKINKESWNKESKQAIITTAIQRKEKRKGGRKRGREGRKRKERKKEVLAFG